MTNHWYDEAADKTRCGEYTGVTAFHISANYAVSCPGCRDLLTPDERIDQKYPFDDGGVSVTRHNTTPTQLTDDERLDIQHAWTYRGGWDAVFEQVERILAARGNNTTHETLHALADEWDATDENGFPLREGSLGEAADDLRAALSPAPTNERDCERGEWHHPAAPCPADVPADNQRDDRLAERAIRLVFEHARENTDEIEGARIALPDGASVWLHTTAAVDEWLTARLAYELEHGAVLAVIDEPTTRTPAASEGETNP